MWPTFLTAYHFPMKMESLSQAFKAAACTVSHARTYVYGTEIQCLLYVTVCKCQDWHITCLLPRGELIHTSVDWCKFNLSLRRSGNTLGCLSPGCFDAVCLNAEKWKANNNNGAPKKRNVGPKIKGSTLVFRTTSSSTHTRTCKSTRCPHSVIVTLMELIWETSVALPGRGIYGQGESQMQSIALPVCLIISHRERWPAKIN